MLGENIYKDMYEKQLIKNKDFKKSQQENEECNLTSERSK